MNAGCMPGTSRLESRRSRKDQSHRRARPYIRTHKSTIHKQDSPSLVAGIRRTRRPYSVCEVCCGCAEFSQRAETSGAWQAEACSQHRGEVGRSRVDNLLDALKTTQIQCCLNLANRSLNQLLAAPSSAVTDQQPYALGTAPTLVTNCIRCHHTGRTKSGNRTHSVMSCLPTLCLSPSVCGVLCASWGPYTV